MLMSLLKVTQSDQGPWMVVLTDKDEIKEATLEEYELQLHQTEDMPLMSKPLVSEFGFLGMGPMVEAVMGGTYIPPAGTKGHMADWLGQLQMVPTPPGVVAWPQLWILMASHMAGWQRACKVMAAGPSGLTTAHFKAGT